MDRNLVAVKTFLKMPDITRRKFNRQNNTFESRNYKLQT